MSETKRVALAIKRFEFGPDADFSPGPKWREYEMGMADAAIKAMRGNSPEIPDSSTCKESLQVAAPGVLRQVREALKRTLALSRGTSGRIILELDDEDVLRQALALIDKETKTNP